MSRTALTKRHRKQETAILALLSESSIKAAAEKCGVSEETLYAWMRDDAFMARFHEVRGQMVGGAVLRLQANVMKAVDVLYEIAGDAKQLGATRVAAASKILDTSLKLIDTERENRRAEKLESALTRRIAGDSEDLPALTDGGPEAADGAIRETG